MYYYQAIKRNVPSRKRQRYLIEFSNRGTGNDRIHVLPESLKAKYEAMRDTFINNIELLHVSDRDLEIGKFQIFVSVLIAPIKIPFAISLGWALSRRFLMRHPFQMLGVAESRGVLKLANLHLLSFRYQSFEPHEDQF